MVFSLQPMKPQERKFCYTHSDPLMARTGCIGMLRATLDNAGTGFISNWEDHQENLKVPAFRDEFETVLDMLKYDERYGHILKNCGAMMAYGWSHPDCQFERNGPIFGFRADTNSYSYMLRLDPKSQHNNVYCYCYSRDMLERHMRQAEKGIRFVTSKGKLLFTLADEDSVRITGKSGVSKDYSCFYVADGLVELQAGQYFFWHIRELLESIERNGGSIIPLRSSLPEKCFGIDPDSSKMVVITKGIPGVTLAGTLPIGATIREGVDKLNEAMGVTPAQAAAMLAGALHGWDRPEADPTYYDRNGRAIKPKSKDDFER